VSDENGNRKITARVQGTCQGYHVELEFSIELHHLSAALQRLQHYGITPTAQPWATTPEGTPICPRHNIPMQKREKQGDTWHSHKITTSGKDYYCRGYPTGKPDDGYNL
jgi:hypothetical protein